MLDLGAFCIDATEVTNSDYAAWLATSPSTATQPAACAFNVSFLPASGWPAPPADGGRPVSRVDWCDAHAYCAGVGKRLCGHLGGGVLAFGAFADPTQSEWMAACSNGGTTAYPYGDGYVAATCDGKDAQLQQTAVAGSEAQCHGPSGVYASLFDMSGNVAEWEDACSGTSGPNDVCRRRGGSYKDGSTALGCAADPGNTPRSFTGSSTGFRCCAP
jgi:formylglycine-generating enzyme required for sulfatase activity